MIRAVTIITMRRRKAMMMSRRTWEGHKEKKERKERAQIEDNHD